jgi:cytochrome c oxidase cbb3-type subunit 3/ubiquinol-cytochrome c reductase cytochrome c subunit
LIGTVACAQKRESTGASAKPPAPDVQQPLSTNDPSAAHGEELYGKYCALCHGANGEGYRADNATNLANEEFLAIASDVYLRASIARGRPGTVMSAWGQTRGGPLSESDINAVVAFLRTWQKRPYASVDGLRTTGSAARGAPVYEAQCQRCHGKNGTGGPYLQLANPELLGMASDGYLRTSIDRGRPGTPMPAFETRLTPVERDDLVAFLRGTLKPVEIPVEMPPPAGKLENIVLHPKGPAPGFDPKAQFLSVDTVKAAYDKGASFILSDARPPSDYAASHIAGAISVPFYMVDQYVAQIPKNKFIITYCGCPHAESGKAADAFRKKGYTNVAVLDEGFNVWKTRGYPVASGPKPIAR